MPVHTHYDNLKVTRNAPVEVIRAAYRVMAQKYHPDLNTSPQAAEVMRIVNEAWAALSDPAKRAEHDRWIREKELLEQRPAEGRSQGDGPHRSASDSDRANSHERGDNHGRRSQAGKRPQSSTQNAGGATAGSSPNGDTHTFGKRSPLVAGIIAVAGMYVLGATGTLDRVSDVFKSRSDSAHVVQAPHLAEPNLASDGGTTAPRYERCIGSYEPEACRQAEERLASESLEERRRRQRQLDKETQTARETVFAGIPTAAPQGTAASTTTGSTTFGASPYLSGHEVFGAPQPEPTAGVKPWWAAAPLVEGVSAQDPALAKTAPQPFSEDRTLLSGPSRHLGKVGARGGRSSIEIDNGSGSEDVEVRLYRHGAKPHVRAMLVRAGETFTSDGIAAGAYAVRWRALGSQRVFAADRMAKLEERHVDNGIRFSRIRMTLYTVPGGNMTTTQVAAEQF